MSTLCIEEHQNQLHLLVKPPPLLDASVNKKKLSAEASCLYKIAEEDFSLQSCDDLNL